MCQHVVPLLLATLLMGCSAGSSLASKKGCVSAEGIWVDARYGEPGSGYCVVPTADAGQVCKSKSQCQTACVTSDAVKRGEPATGECFAWSSLVGHCVNLLDDDGLAQGTICHD